MYSTASGTSQNESPPCGWSESGSRMPFIKMMDKQYLDDEAKAVESKNDDDIDFDDLSFDDL